MTDRVSRPLWLMILAAALTVFLAMGARSTFGLFLEPISDHMGWGREIFGLTFAIQNIVWGATQPFSGALADRFGSGRVLSLGGILYIAGLLLMAEASTPLAMHLTGGVLIGLAQGMASMSIGMATVARHTPVHRRTLLMSIVTMGGSAGQLVFSPVAPIVIGSYGYVFTLMAMAAMVALIVPLALPLSGRPPAAVYAHSQSFGEALREASRHRGYWLLVGGFFVCGFHVAFIGLHLPAYVEDSGLEPWVGGVALATVGAFNIGGTLLSGALGDKFSKKYLLSSLYFARAGAILFLILMPTTVEVVLIFSAVIGVLWLSTVPLTTGLVGQIFGPQYMGMLAGVVFFSHQIGSFLGAYLGGMLYDTTGSYDIVWWISLALGLFAGLVHWPIDEKPIERAIRPAV